MKIELEVIKIIDAIDDELKRRSGCPIVGKGAKRVRSTAGARTQEQLDLLKPPALKCLKPD